MAPMPVSQPEGEQPGPGDAASPPSAFTASYLHVGKTVRHELSRGRLRWSVTDNPTSVYEHDCRSIRLGERLWLLAFRKGPDEARLSTYLILDLASKAAFDASYLPSPRGAWRFDRGSLGDRVTLGTPLAFPRADATAFTADPRARAFTISRELILITSMNEERTGGGPAIEVLDVGGPEPVSRFLDTVHSPTECTSSR